VSAAALVVVSVLLALVTVALVGALSLKFWIDWQMMELQRQLMLNAILWRDMLNDWT
jgi:hypothetical protein